MRNWCRALMLAQGVGSREEEEEEEEEEEKEEEGSIVVSLLKVLF